MIENYNQLLAWQPDYPVYPIIGNGILSAESRMIIFGGAKSWKSMLSIYTGHRLAEGTTWFGFKCTRCVTFLYQIELPKHIFKSRMVKYVTNLNGAGERFPENFLFKTDNYVKLDSTYGIQSLDKDIATVRLRYPGLPVVLIIDPIYKVISGKITDEYDVKRFIDNLDELKSKHHVAIILIHHTHKTRVDSAGNVIDLGAEEAMGSSYFLNWPDTILRLKMMNENSGADIVTASFQMFRNVEDIIPNFTMKWSRSNLQPEIIRKELPPEPTIQGLAD